MRASTTTKPSQTTSTQSVTTIDVQAAHVQTSHVQLSTENSTNTTSHPTTITDRPYTTLLAYNGTSDFQLLIPMPPPPLHLLPPIN